ncbi:MAG: hypothetical protein JKY34_09390 [Kordiimonadaceae bacterium]|nr:hypothetical protein [Kordiimonadaceae bacterium]
MVRKLTGEKQMWQQRFSTCKAIILVALGLLYAEASLAQTSPEGVGQKRLADRPTAEEKPVGAQFLVKAGCVACHGMDEVRIGPSYRSIAEQYTDADADTLEWLAQKIVFGGVGKWGVVPMVANPHVQIEEARESISWILKNAKEQ